LEVRITQQAPPGSFLSRTARGFDTIAVWKWFPVATRPWLVPAGRILF